MKTETKEKDPAELGGVLVEALGEEHFFVTPMGLGIRTGTHGWRWPGSAISWVTEQGARGQLTEHMPEGVDLEAGPEYFDTRLTFQEVQRLVAKAEREAYLYLNGIPAAEARAYLAGPWNEYLAPCWGIDESRPWPHDCYVSVFVIPGANEGLALRVETCDEHHELLLTGKSLGCSWESCYESAGRISALLNQ